MGGAFPGPVIDNSNVAKSFHSAFRIFQYKETWSFDGTAWSGENTVALGGPEGFYRPALCSYDDGLYYFGGAIGNVMFNELWDIRQQATVPAMEGWGVIILVFMLSGWMIFRKK